MTHSDELYSLLIPLPEERLLVPRLCVAEVVGAADMTAASEDERSDWFVGTIGWNNRKLPVVSLNAGKEQSSGSQRDRRRIVVFHGLTEAMRGRYYGVLTQGFPQLVRVNNDVIAADQGYVPPTDRPILCRVRMIHEYPLVPDFDKLERMVSQLPVN